MTSTRGKTEAHVAIDVAGVHKSYDGKAVLRGIDLQVRAGETLAILGPNGAGKTTLVEILEGYRAADSGAASVLGAEPSNGTPRWRSRIGVVVQDGYTLGWNLKVRETLQSVALYYRRHRDIDDLLDRVGLTEKRDAWVNKLSGGQRRRLDVACALVGYPELLFVDEPTTGFDPQARREFWALLDELKADEGITIVLTTHYLDEAEHLADRVAILAHGRIAALDTPDRVGRTGDADAVVSWTEHGTPRTEHTNEPTAVVTRLAAELGGEVPHLQVRRPTLEESYLAFIATESSADATPTQGSHA